MEQYIFDIIKEYQNSNRSVDTEFVNLIISLLIDYYDLNNYITNTKIYNNKNMHQAQYNVTTKEIGVNPDSINKLLLYLEKEFERLKYNKTFSYLYVTKILIHEIEHAHQQKKVQELCDIESEILHAEYGYYYDIMEKNKLLRIPKMIHLNKTRDKYYNFAPSERLAEHIACEKTEKLAIIMQDEESYEVIQSFKYGNILRGYNVGLINYLSNAPTKAYLEKVNPKYDYATIENLALDINQYDKMKFGLEVENEILNETAQNWLKVYMKIKNNRHYI